jgi:undecaprenyl-diphosphatase
MQKTTNKLLIYLLFVTITVLTILSLNCCKNIYSKNIIHNQNDTSFLQQKNMTTIQLYIKRYIITLKTKKIYKIFANIDYLIFKLINSKIKINIIDFFIIPFSFCDSVNFNISFFIMITIYIYILLKNRKNTFKNDLIILLISLIVGIIITYYLKHLFLRQRPINIFDKQKINLFFEKDKSFSFPSGHTEITINASTFMYMFIKKYWYIYFIFSIFSCFYRIYAGIHFPSDIIASIIIGISSSYITIFTLKKYI